MLLSRLDRVRRCGRGWIACCPAHKDRSASLSVSAGDDDRVLLHCFAGCSSAEVVHALGLELGDLFVRRMQKDLSPTERSVMREHSKQAQWQAALNVLDYEATVLLVAMQRYQSGEPLTPDDAARLQVAGERITNARAVFLAR